MSLLGKLLLFVNLLAAGGLTFLATQDWAKRQEISGVVVRHQLVLNGLPLEALPAGDDAERVPMEVPLSGSVTTESISKKLLVAHFAGTVPGEFGGVGEPTSQLGELKAVYDKILAASDNRPNDLAKVTFLCGGLANGQFVPGVLQRLAETYEERQAIRNLALVLPEQMAASRKAAEERLKRKFDAVLSNPEPRKLDDEVTRIAALKDKAAAGDINARTELTSISADGALPFTRDDGDRRRRIAKLLMFVDPLAGYQKRVAMTIGLTEYLATLTDQTGKLEEMARRIERGYELEQLLFDDEYTTIKNLALTQDQLLLLKTRVTSGYERQMKADQEISAKRQGQLKELQDELTTIQTEVATLTKTLSETETELFALQQKVGNTLRANLIQEAKLEAAETK